MFLQFLTANLQDRGSVSEETEAQQGEGGELSKVTDPMSVESRSDPSSDSKAYSLSFSKCTYFYNVLSRGCACGGGGAG